MFWYINVKNLCQSRPPAYIFTKVGMSGLNVALCIRVLLLGDGSQNMLQTRLFTGTVWLAVMYVHSTGRCGNIADQWTGATNTTAGRNTGGLKSQRHQHQQSSRLFLSYKQLVVGCGGIAGTSMVVLNVIEPAPSVHLQSYIKHLYFCAAASDAKRSHTPEAKDNAKASNMRPKLRPRPNVQNWGQKQGRR